ncbi:hypothetical protein FS594_03130 [Rahnella aquatilis]|uniref:Uncharacterized protein n=1 Tax=Rahnella perminowiae TaxID=2816244 RepID=A0ABS6L0C7_9GAMM|nr:hypothetical protein [Rahnella perminowiae]MBU9835158.1 hypothetical protein [Rahnella perminowiae]UJD87860.1 hypothetical protein FS594_03130 [Rahnella aquatilis]
MRHPRKNIKKKRPASEDVSRSFLSCEQTSPSGKVSLTKIDIHFVNVYHRPGNRVAEMALKRGSRHRNDDYPAKKLLPFAVRKLMQNVSDVKYSETF